MAFPNLDKCSCGSPRAPKVSVGSHGLGSHKFSLVSKRSGSLKNKCDVDFVTETNRKNSVITSQLQFESPASSNQNEYTKTSLDRQSQQERTKRRHLLQQVVSGPLQNKPGSQAKESTVDNTTQLIEDLDPSDDVFVNHYKQVRSANRTFSTFLGPTSHPQKYLKDDKIMQQKVLQYSQSNQSISSPAKHVVSGDDTDDQQDRTSEYTPLSFDTNYVKVSPPKLTRRQKKSGGSESDASREPPPNGQPLPCRKVRKDKAQSPKESRRFPADDDPNASDRPNSSSSEREGSSSARNSDVFGEDDSHLPLPPPILDFSRKNLSSNDSEDFPPPPSSATWETTSDYISLENAEKRALLSQSSDDSPPSTADKSRHQPSKGSVKANKSESRVPSCMSRSMSDKDREPLLQCKSEAGGDRKDDSSFLEFKLTVRLEGNGPNKKMTVKDMDTPDGQFECVSDLKTSAISDKSDSGEENQKNDLKSAIVAEICDVVTKSLTKEKFSSALQNSDTPSQEHVVKSFQNSAYGIPCNEMNFEKFKSNTPLVAHRTITKGQNIDESTQEGQTKGTQDETNSISTLDDFEKIKSLQKSKKQTLADFVSSKVTTVAQVHHSADDILAEEKQPMHESIFSLDMKRSPIPTEMESLDAFMGKKSSERKYGDSADGCPTSGKMQFQSSKQTHMNWDDLMEEAKSLGIPLSRPSHTLTTSASSKKQNSQHLCDTIQEVVSSTRSELLAKQLLDKSRPISSDSAVGTSVSSVSSATGLTLPKNTAPKLISHKAALDQSTPLNEDCCCCCGCCVPEKNGRGTSEFNKCNCGKTGVNQLQSKSSAALVQSPKSEKKFSFFKDRLKLSNFFCKRFCSKSVERQPTFVGSGRQQCSCPCGKNTNQAYNCHQSQLSRQTQQRRSSILRDRSSSRNGSVQMQKGMNLRSSSTVGKDFEVASVGDDGANLTSRRDQVSRSLASNSIDRCFSSMESKVHDRGSKSNPMFRRRTSDDKSQSSPTNDWSPNDLFKNLEKIKKHEWYWGPIGFEEAESLLDNRADGSFMVRDSSDDRYILSLSFRSQGCTHHTRIEQHRGRFSFFSHSSSHEASSVDEFIANAMKLSSEGKSLYYLRPKSPNSLPIPVQLLYPVIRPSSPGSTPMQKVSLVT